MKEKNVVDVREKTYEMQSEFEDQVAIVTGAASGIGLSIAEKLLELGAYVAVIDVNEKSLKKNISSAQKCRL